MRENKSYFPIFEGWGNGYACFTYSAQERPNVIEYIRTQKEHHRHKSFREEYDGWLKDMGLDPREDMFFKD